MHRNLKLFVLSLICGVSMGAQAEVNPQKPGVGDGTEANPYQISNVEELVWFRNAVNNGESGLCACLTSDISLKDECSPTEGSWIAIGDFDEGYCGVFDGQGHAITDLYIDDARSNTPSGLFGQGFIYDEDNNSYRNATLRNLLVQGDVKTFGYSGMLVGYGVDIVIENVTTEGTLTVKDSKYVQESIGGILGYAQTARITDCVNKAIVSVPSIATNGDPHLHVGGLFGCVDVKATVERSMNYANIVASGAMNVGGLGGLVGDASISDCGSCGMVSGYDNVAGIVGAFTGYDEHLLSVRRSYNCRKLTVGEKRDKAFDAITNKLDTEGTLSYNYCFALEGQPNGSDQNVRECKTEDFRWGRVAYQLQQKSDVWGQNNIGSDYIYDMFPCPGGAKVYWNSASFDWVSKDHTYQGNNETKWSFRLPAKGLVNVQYLGTIDGYGNSLKLEMREGSETTTLMDMKVHDSHVFDDGSLTLTGTTGKDFVISFYNANGGEVANGGLNVDFEWYANTPSYSLFNMTDGTPGDMNDDHKYTIADVAMYINDMRSEVLERRHDLTGDGECDALDVEELVRRVFTSFNYYAK